MRLVFALILMGLSIECATHRPAVPLPLDPCASRGDAVVVRTAARRLFLCEAGAEVRVFPAQLGSGGTAKRLEGDKKTPLGSYSLGAPRASKYRLFIPVGYPTAEQTAAGFSGGAIGIHGPKRSLRWLGRMHRGIDWTRGCIAVATDAEIDAIAVWVRAHEQAQIHLE